MKLRLISWNIRGLNNPQKRDVVKNLLKDWRGDVVCLQETKLASVDGSIVHSLWGNPCVGWAVLDAIGLAGGVGVLLMWDKRMFMK